MLKISKFAQRFHIATFFSLLKKKKLYFFSQSKIKTAKFFYRLHEKYRAIRQSAVGKYSDIIQSFACEISGKLAVVRRQKSRICFQLDNVKKLNFF